MRKLIFFLFLFLTSCSSGEIIFSPEGERLQNARVGTFYQQNVVLTFHDSGEVITLGSNNFRSKVTPGNSGLDIEPNFSRCENISSEVCNDSNKVIIKGVPKIKGIVTIEIVAKTYASMYSKSQVFVKKYQITVD